MKPKEIKVNQFVLYKGEVVRVVNLMKSNKIHYAFVSNLNMPLDGSISGWVDIGELSKRKR